jgi:hypothetical protein
MAGTLAPALARQETGTGDAYAMQRVTQRMLDRAHSDANSFIRANQGYRQTQYIAVAAGGNAQLDCKRGNQLIAYRPGSR